MAEEDISIRITVDGADDAARQTNTVAASMQEAATQSIALGQRLAGMASAVQGLIGQLGGGSRTAGLIGATLQTSVQFAQMGAALGPGGSLVGGIVGALVPAWQGLMAAMEPVAAAQIEIATATTTASTALTAQAAAADRARDSLSEFLDTLDSGSQTSRLGNIGEQVRILADELTSLGDGTLEQLNRRYEIQSEIVRLQRQAQEIADEVQSGTLAGRDAPPARHAPTISDEKTNILAKQAEDRIAALAAETAAQDELTAAIGRWADEGARAAEQELARHEVELQMHQEDLAFAAAAAQKEKDAAIERSNAIAQEASSATNGIISSLTDVLGKLADGSATAEEAAQLMLASFLQSMSQRATIEALAQVAEAIGSVPVVPLVAAHAAAALAWGAVAVATGVGAGAISAGVGKAQAARAEAEKPASPQQSVGGSGSGSGTTVINFNSPVVTATTTADLGRSLGRIVAVGERRYPGAV